MIYENSTTILSVQGLRASITGTEILKGIDLTVKSGEIHAIMGLNGSGKSTFAKVLAGHSAYEVTGGSVQFEGKKPIGIASRRTRPCRVIFGFPISH